MPVIGSPWKARATRRRASASKPGSTTGMGWPWAFRPVIPKRLRAAGFQWSRTRPSRSTPKMAMGDPSRIASIRPGSRGAARIRWAASRNTALPSSQSR